VSNHAQRLEQALPHEVRQRLAAQALYDRALQIHRHAVAPLRPRLVQQRKTGHRADERISIRQGEQPSVAVERVDRLVWVAAVAEAGGVGHELGHGRRVRRRLEADGAVRPGAGRHGDVGELRQVLCDGIVRAPAAFVVEDHHRRGGDRLGHREDAEHRVDQERFAGGQVLFAHGVGVHRLAMAGDKRHRPGQDALVDIALQSGVDGLKPGRRQPHVFRPRRSQITRHRSALP